MPDVADVARAVLHGPEAIVAAGSDGRIFLWNPGAVRIFGYSEDEAVGQSLDLIIPERLRERHWTGWDRVMETGRSRYGEGDLLSVPAEGKGGRRLSVEFTIHPLVDPAGEMTGMAATLRDVTERFEQTRALRRELDQLRGVAGR